MKKMPLWYLRFVPQKILFWAHGVFILYTLAFRIHCFLGHCREIYFMLLRSALSVGCSVSFAAGNAVVCECFHPSIPRIYANLAVCVLLGYNRALDNADMHRHHHHYSPQRCSLKLDLNILPFLRQGRFVNVLRRQPEEA